MLHIRVVSPSAVTGLLLARLKVLPGIQNLIALAIAGLIGAVGILTNSQILIVGAMVVGPEYNAIIAAALGISKRDRGAVGEGLLALIAGFFAAIVVTLAFSAAVRAAGKAPELFLHGVRPVSALINSPNIFSVVVAVLAGIVGVVSLTESRAKCAYRGVHLRHHHPCGRRHRRISRLRQLA